MEEVAATPALALDRAVRAAVEQRNGAPFTAGDIARAIGCSRQQYHSFVRHGWCNTKKIDEYVSAFKAHLDIEVIICRQADGMWSATAIDTQLKL